MRMAQTFAAGMNGDDAGLLDLNRREAYLEEHWGARLMTLDKIRTKLRGLYLGRR